MISYDNIIQVLTTDGPKVVKSHQKRLWVQSLFSPTKEPFHLEERLQFFYQTHTSATVAGHIDTWQAVDARKLWGFLEELILPTRILIGKARSYPTICSKTTSWYLILAWFNVMNVRWSSEAEVRLLKTQRKNRKQRSSRTPKEPAWKVTSLEIKIRWRPCGYSGVFMVTFHANIPISLLPSGLWVLKYRLLEGFIRW